MSVSIDEDGLLDSDAADFDRGSLEGDSLENADLGRFRLNEK